jgi:hypothetical protein
MLFFCECLTSLRGEIFQADMSGIFAGWCGGSYVAVQQCVSKQAMAVRKVCVPQREVRREWPRRGPRQWAARAAYTRNASVERLELGVML